MPPTMKRQSGRCPATSVAAPRDEEKTCVDDGHGYCLRHYAQNSAFADRIKQSSSRSTSDSFTPRVPARQSMGKRLFRESLHSDLRDQLAPLLCAAILSNVDVRPKVFSLQ